MAALFAVGMTLSMQRRRNPIAPAVCCMASSLCLPCFDEVITETFRAGAAPAAARGVRCDAVGRRHPAGLRGGPAGGIRSPAQRASSRFSQWLSPRQRPQPSTAVWQRRPCHPQRSLRGCTGAAAAGAASLRPQLRAAAACRWVAARGAAGSAFARPGQQRRCRHRITHTFR